MHIVKPCATKDMKKEIGAQAGAFSRVSKIELCTYGMSE